MIELRDVTKSYSLTSNAKQRVLALDGINLLISKGDFVSLVGPSGAGKSTLIRMLIAEEKPDHGSILVADRDIAALQPRELPYYRRKIGVVFQDFRLLDHLSLYENVALPLRVLGRDEAGYRAEVTELLRWVGLGERKHAFPTVLSGGEKQRASIARALISQPKILLADEPTGNVDPTLARRLLRLFVELHKSGTAVVIATHDLSLMDQYDEARRLVLADGRLHVFE